MIRAGEIGAVKEVHICNQSVRFGLKVSRCRLTTPPAQLEHVMGSLAPALAKERPYNAIYHPFKAWLWISAPVLSATWLATR
ncbi:MAG: hypothetical protein R3B96_15335 [Pirellulaceae bacterium]